MENNSIPYFPLNCQQDDRIKLIEKEFGLKSFAVIVKLYQKIFATEGYYCKWTEEIEALFSEGACGLPEGNNLVSEIIKAAFKRGIFSKELFDQYTILTSEEIQEKFISVIGKRKKSVKMKKSYLLLEYAKIPKNVEIESEDNTRAPESFEVKGSEVKGSEVKGSEVKENEDNTSCAEPEQAASAPAHIITFPLNDKSEYPIYQNEIDEWEELYPAVDIMQELRKMKGWLMANPARRKTQRGIKKFINGWLSKEQDKGGTNSHGTNSTDTGIASQTPKKYGMVL